MTDYELLSVADAQLWHKYLSHLPDEQQDVHFTPEYFKLYEAKGDGVAKCFIFEDGKDLAIYPFLIKGINGLGYDLDHEYYDIQGVYGYNGIALTTNKSEFQRAFMIAFADFMAKKRIISEFIRINPVLDSLFQYSDYYEITKRNTLYYTNLQADSILYDEYEHSSRKNIKKAKRMGVTVKSGESLDKSDLLNIFCDIYNKTMDRNKADSVYYFTEDFFSEIMNTLSDSSKFYIAYLDEVAISAELVLFDKNRAYSFLGGTKAEYFAYRPNDLLKHTIIEDLREKGLKHFVLGGGYADGDGLSRYKKSFAKNSGIDYCFGNKIHDQEVYNEVMRQWKENHPEMASKHSDAFQGYRII